MVTTQAKVLFAILVVVAFGVVGVVLNKQQGELNQLKFNQVKVVVSPTVVPTSVPTATPSGVLKKVVVTEPVKTVTKGAVK